VSELQDPRASGIPRSLSRLRSPVRDRDGRSSSGRSSVIGRGRSRCGNPVPFVPKNCKALQSGFQDARVVSGGVRPRPLGRPRAGLDPPAGRVEEAAPFGDELNAQAFRFFSVGRFSFSFQQAHPMPWVFRHSSIARCLRRLFLGGSYSRRRTHRYMRLWKSPRLSRFLLIRGIVPRMHALLAVDFSVIPDVEVEGAVGM